MSIIYCIFLYILAIRIFVRDMTRKNCFIAISIVTALMLLSDITTIISAGILTYLKYQGWQIILAYVLGILWIFNGSISLRRMKFKHNFKQKESAIKTANGRKITYAILTALMLIIGSACLVLYLNKKILAIISFIAPYIIAVLLIILLIKTMLSLNEEFVLVTEIGSIKHVYRKKIETGKLNYKDIVGDLSKNYFIYDVAVVHVSGDIKRTEYVYILKLEELKENPFSELGLALDDSISPDLYINLYDNKRKKAKIKIINNNAQLN